MLDTHRTPGRLAALFVALLVGSVAGCGAPAGDGEGAGAPIDAPEAGPGETAAPAADSEGPAPRSDPEVETSPSDLPETASGTAPDDAAVQDSEEAPVDVLGAPSDSGSDASDALGDDPGDGLDATEGDLPSPPDSDTHDEPEGDLAAEPEGGTPQDKDSEDSVDSVDSQDAEGPEPPGDPCEPNPCKAGGTCLSLEVGFACECPIMTEGETCEVDLCPSIPQGPFELEPLSGPLATEDLAFDAHGHLIGCNDKALFKSKYNKPPQLWVPNTEFHAGLRFTPDGDLLYCDNELGALVKVHKSGVKHTVLTGLAWPNGLTIGLDGLVYFTDSETDDVHRFDPKTYDHDVIATGIDFAEGLTFNVDYSRLYVASGWARDIWVIDFDDVGSPGEKFLWHEDVGDPDTFLDGLAVDACGNIYATDFDQGAVYRISKSGATSTKIADAGDPYDTVLPNLQWGSGYGGWDPFSLYIPDMANQGIFELKVGVPSKPVPWPPPPE